MRFSAEVLIPFLQEECGILDHDSPNLRHLVRAKTPRVRYRHRVKPEFRVPLRIRNVDVWWLTSLQTEKEEPISPDLRTVGTLQV